jgi:hypothetical protein
MNKSFLSAIQNILATVTDPAKRWDAAIFKFEMSSEAALHSERILQNNMTSTKPLQLSKILLWVLEMNSGPYHIGATTTVSPTLAKTKNLLLHGTTLPLEPISDELQTTDNHFHLQWGNHKSALLHNAQLASELNEDVSRGLSLPFPVICFPNLKHLSIAPLGITRQSTIKKASEPSIGE